MRRHRGEAGTRGSLAEICIGNAGRLGAEDRHMATIRRGDHTGHWPDAAHHQDILRDRKPLAHVLK